RSEAGFAQQNGRSEGFCVEQRFVAWRVLSSVPVVMLQSSKAKKEFSANEHYHSHLSETENSRNGQSE
ncbi:MAG: hypothetical protein ACLFNQ_11290, partial [Spirochaetaceae bacterium]